MITKLNKIITNPQAIKEQRLLRAKVLLQVIEGIPEERVNLDIWSSRRNPEKHCGSVACIGGWAQTYFHNDMKRVGASELEEYFGGVGFRITPNGSWCDLFDGNHGIDWGSTQKERAINRIKTFIEAIEDGRAPIPAYIDFR